MNDLKRIIFVEISLLVSLSSFSIDYTSFIANGIGYKILSGNTEAVTNTNVTYSGNVIIPETVTYGGIIYSVTTIEASCFSGCPSLTSITTL